MNRSHNAKLCIIAPLLPGSLLSGAAEVQPWIGRAHPCLRYAQLTADAVGALDERDTRVDAIRRLSPSRLNPQLHVFLSVYPEPCRVIRAMRARRRRSGQGAPRHTTPVTRSPRSGGVSGGGPAKVAWRALAGALGEGGGSDHVITQTGLLDQGSMGVPGVWKGCQPPDLATPVGICSNRPTGFVQEVEAMPMLRPG
jgi:hypothetical protein